MLADGGASAARTYYLYVANESSDIVSKVAFSPDSGARVVKEIPVGLMLADPDAPHGLAVSPDGESWYVSLAHGTPFGSVWKYSTAEDTLVGRVQLGRFPASMGLTPDGTFLFVSNFNLHGEHVPSGISVVYAPEMIEVARPTTCVMPHGGRVNVAGTRHYSTCMHSDQLVELDATSTFQVTGRMSLIPGAETSLAVDDSTSAGGAHDHGADSPVCSPTWVAIGRGARANRFVYVSCNRLATVLEIDVVDWRVTRRFETGEAPYNLETTPDGRLLLITLRGAQGVAIVDLERGTERARIPTTQPITHGVVVSPDGRYAFVTNEAVGSTRGTLDVIDLGRFERVASVELRHQPGGVDFWTVR
ncbi:MAG TPA: YncE family protein [Longimicrobiales bacterium]|nr:YncE family protein [Longimicrobiales bacterium]